VKGDDCSRKCHFDRGVSVRHVADGPLDWIGSPRLCDALCSGNEGWLKRYPFERRIEGPVGDGCPEAPSSSGATVASTECSNDQTLINHPFESSEAISAWALVSLDSRTSPDRVVGTVATHLRVSPQGGAFSQNFPRDSSRFATLRLNSGARVARHAKSASLHGCTRSKISSHSMSGQTRIPIQIDQEERQGVRYAMSNDRYGQVAATCEK
jgi:hypothetical protein